MSPSSGRPEPASLRWSTLSAVSTSRRKDSCSSTGEMPGRGHSCGCTATSVMSCSHRIFFPGRYGRTCVTGNLTLLTRKSCVHFALFQRNLFWIGWRKGWIRTSARAEAFCRRARNSCFHLRERFSRTRGFWCSTRRPRQSTR